MEKVWIIGAGKFGLLAAKRLRKNYQILIVDTDSVRLRIFEDMKLTFVQNDGVNYLAKNLSRNTDVAWIIPALPVHLAWEWSRNKIGRSRLKPLVLPDKALPLLPNPIRGKFSHIYTSHAEFVCPDNCSEPDLYCTHTGKPRKQDMDQLLESISFGAFEPMVLKSHQLEPGVGGYRPKSLYNLLDRINQANGPLLICTACRCHGVVTGAVRCAS